MYKFYSFLKNLRAFQLFIVASIILICYTACSVLPPVTKVHPGNINTKGVLFMLPKAEVYVNFAHYKTDSIKGIIAGYPKLIEELNDLYFPEVKKPIQSTCTTYKYSHFLITEKFVQDTSEMYSINISKNKKHFFTNLAFALSLSEQGIIESTNLTAENQSVAVFATMAGFALSDIVPHLPALREKRGVSDTTQFIIAVKLLDSLKHIKYKQREHYFNPGKGNSELTTEQFILDNLSASEDRILTALIGTSKTTVIDSLSIPVPLDKDSLYVIETRRHDKCSYKVMTGAEGQNSDYVFKIQPVWLTSFKNTAKIKKTTGMPYKMPEHIVLNIYNSSNELYASGDIIVPGKSTFYLPNKMGALKSSLNVEYNPDGTIKNISSGYTSAGQADAQALINNFNNPPSQSQPAPSNRNSASDQNASSNPAPSKSTNPKK